MVDVSQWRASIGLWNGSSYCSSSSGKSVSGPVYSSYGWTATSTAQMMISTILLLIGASLLLPPLLLILSGDVELNPGPGKDEVIELLQEHSANLATALTANLFAVSDKLHVKGLITFETKNDVQTASGLSDYKRASRLVSVLQSTLKSSVDSKAAEGYLQDVCKVFVNPQHDHQLTELAFVIGTRGNFLAELKAASSVMTTECTQQMLFITALKSYCCILKDNYSNWLPIIDNNAEWPPKIGCEYFGNLVLLSKYITKKAGFSGSLSTEQTKTWLKMRGKVDEISDIDDRLERIKVGDIFRTCEGNSVVLVDGPPGIGKTTLCRKLVNMWVKGELIYQQQQHYDLVLFCSLRIDRIIQSNTLSELMNTIYQCPDTERVSEWFNSNHGEGLLIIFDGWDELSTENRKNSLAARIIRRELLCKCSVIITSRSYASSSVLKQPRCAVNKHIEVIGFSKKVIEKVIKGTLVEDLQSANNLIHELEVHHDVQSLCYVPLVCSMVIMIYKKNGQLPTTLTELYKNFILQTIRRHHVRKTDLDDDTELIELVYSLDQLPSELSKPFNKLCRLSYLGLKIENPKLTFSLRELKQTAKIQTTSDSKEGYLGLMTTLTVYDESMYQFLHLSIQEFLAAWWIATNNMEVEVFKQHFTDDHFRLCLKFVAGLTRLRQSDNFKDYFDYEKPLDFCCSRRPLFQFEESFYSEFHKNTAVVYTRCNDEYDYTSQNKDFYQFFQSSKCFDSLLLHLLYESQNVELCHTLAVSCFKDRSLCLKKMLDVSFSQFDTMCLCYFLNNSAIVWSDIDLALVFEDISAAMSLDASTEPESGLDTELYKKVLNNTTATCDVLHCYAGANVEPVFKHSSHLLANLQECYFTFETLSLTLNNFCNFFFILFNSSRIQVIHLKVLSVNSGPDGSMDVLSQLQEAIANKSSLQELKLTANGRNCHNKIIVDAFCHVILGVTHSKTIKSFGLVVEDDDKYFSHQQDYATKVRPLIKRLLQVNCTLQALHLDINLGESDEVMETGATSSLQSMKIGSYDHYEGHTHHDNPNLNRLAKSFLSGVKKMKSLVLNQPCSPSHVLSCSPNLQKLDISLDTADSVDELFMILRQNTELKVLRVVLLKCDIINNVGTSLLMMLTDNKTIQALNITIHRESYANGIALISYSYLSCLKQGLSANNTLQSLGVPIPLLDNPEEIIPFFRDVLSVKHNLTEIHLEVGLERTIYRDINTAKKFNNDDLIKKFFTQAVHFTSLLLKFHKTVKLINLKVLKRGQINFPMGNSVANALVENALLHPELEYISFNPSWPTVVQDVEATDQVTIYEALLDQKEIHELWDKFTKSGRSKPPPVIDYINEPVFNKNAFEMFNFTNLIPGGIVPYPTFSMCDVFTAITVEDEDDSDD